VIRLAETLVTLGGLALTGWGVYRSFFQTRAQRLRTIATGSLQAGDKLVRPGGKTAIVLSPPEPDPMSMARRVETDAGTVYLTDDEVDILS
jgi:hypothetical protein